VSSEARLRKVLFIVPSFGLRLADDLHELSDNIAQHAFG
jgi:hypothetical protein